jgi:hypothetical protein
MLQLTTGYDPKVMRGRFGYYIRYYIIPENCITIHTFQFKYYDDIPGC